MLIMDSAYFKTMCKCKRSFIYLCLVQLFLKSVCAGINGNNVLSTSSAELPEFEIHPMDKTETPETTQYTIKSIYNMFDTTEYSTKSTDNIFTTTEMSSIQSPEIVSDKDVTSTQSLEIDINEKNVKSTRSPEIDVHDKDVTSTQSTETYVNGEEFTSTSTETSITNEELNSMRGIGSTREYIMESTSTESAVTTSVYSTEPTTSQTVCHHDMAIIDFKIVYNDSRSVEFSWDFPDKSCLEGYNISYSENDIQSIGPDETDFDFTDVLEPCLQYTFTIVPIFLDSDIIGIPKSLDHIMESEPPGQVRNLQIIPNHYGLNVTWEIPHEAPFCVGQYMLITLDSDNGRMCWSSDDNSCKSEIIPPLKAIHLTQNTFLYFDGLRPCTKYHITVVVMNKQNNPINETDAMSGFNTTLNEEVKEVGTLLLKPSSSEITAMWDFPLNNSECVLEYEIKWNTGSQREKNTSFKIKELDACTKYTVEVCPIDVTGNKGIWKRETTTTLDDFPSLVTNITVEQKSNNFFIEWNPPLHASNCVDNYTVRYNERNKTIERTTENTFIDIKNVIGCYEYTFEITAITSENKTGIATNHTQRTIERVANTPTNILLTELNKTWAIFEWKVENYVDNDCSLNNITINCYIKNNISETPIATKTEPIISGSTETIINVTGLSPFKNYTCSGFISNSAGNSNSSQSIDIETAEDVPGAPMSVQIESVSHKDITIKWNVPEDVPGILEEYKIIIRGNGRQYRPSKDCDNDIDKKIYTFDFKNNGTDLRFNFVNALPYTAYSVSVAAKTGAGYGESSQPENVTTKMKEPDEVRDIKVSILTNTSENYESKSRISWTEPCDTFGPLKEYHLTIIGTRYNYDSIIQNINTIEPTYLYNLTPEYKYTVTIYAVNNYFGKKDNTEFFAPAGVPSKARNELKTPDPFSTEKPCSEAFVTFGRSLFDTTNGEIVYYSLIVAYDNYDLKPGYQYLDSENSSHWPLEQKWSPDHNKILSYQATEIKWQPEFDSDNLTKYILGAKKDCSNQESYCNGPLKSKSKYKLIVRAFTKTAYRDSHIVTFTTGACTPYGIILGSIFGVLLVGGFVAVIIYLKNGRQLPWGTRLYPTPIPISKFPGYFVELKANSAKLNNEYLLITSLSMDFALSTEAAERPFNQNRNRYKDIKPYDFNRVKLKSNPDGSDYINASFIKGFSGENEYIAAQGPKEETCTDFWQMVFDFDVRQIIMLTKPVENGKPKCFKYYPSRCETVEFENNFAVRCATELIYNSYTSRKLLVRKDNLQKTVTQLHFTQWPDFKCPSTTHSILQFCQTMRHQHTQTPGLIVVHCSAGVGRTGTLIAVDILMQQLRASRKLDVFGTVFDLRKQRAKMVQTEEQYRFVYSCIYDAINDPTLFQQDNNTSANSLEPIYENNEAITQLRILESQM